MHDGVHPFENPRDQRAVADVAADEFEPVVRPHGKK
jgi:hypothetical protein